MKGIKIFKLSKPNIIIFKTKNKIFKNIYFKQM